LASHIDRLARIGGHLALDFANTAGWHARAERVEHLTGYADLLGWARQEKLVSASEAGALARRAEANPRAAAQALHRAIDYREAVYRVFARLAQDQVPEPKDLALLHAGRIQALERAMPRWKTAGGLTLQWPADASDLERPLYPVLIAASDLLGSDELARLNQCGNHPCGWLFIDRTKAGTRRWCSSAECGNAARVRRFRERRAQP
jgi:predicted RNA-binding Zn ribbon-like protein